MSLDATAGFSVFFFSSPSLSSAAFASPSLDASSADEFSFASAPFLVFFLAPGAAGGLRFFAASPASLKYASCSAAENPSTDLSKATTNTSPSLFTRSERKASNFPSALKRGARSLSGWRVIFCGALEPSMGTSQMSRLKSRSSCANAIHFESGLH